MLRSFCMALIAALAAASPTMATDVQTAPVEMWKQDPTARFEASEVVLDDFLWLARPVIVFADTPADPRFQEQMDLLSERTGALAERDVVIIIDTDPQANSDIRRKLRPRGFMLTLVGKDGGVKLRKPLPWSVREINRSIDKMPMRRQEIRDQGVTQ